MNGWLILDKPAGMTSTKAGSLIKRAFKVKSLGHAGTLDPFATGILPLALGEATKIMPYIASDIKEYECEITFGEQRDTDDVEGQVTDTTTVIPTAQQIQDCLPHFRGRITQIPPVYSALKINGQRAYDLARQGIEVKMKSREVDIFELELISMITPTVAKLRVLCGPGTYIRSLGRDIAVHLNSLGYLSQLRRTRVGKFSLKNAVELDTILNEASLRADACQRQQLLLSIRDVLDDIPAFPVSDNDKAIKIRQGQFLACADICGCELEDQTILLLHDNKELALADVKEGLLYPKRVFNL